IQARAPGVFPRKAMSLFLHRYTTSTAYLKALVALPHRFDLDGAPAGDVAAEHREAAQVELQRRQAIVQEKRTAQRRMDRPPRPGQGPRAGAHGQAGLQPVSDAAAPENAAPENVPAGVDNSSQSPAPGNRPGRPAHQPRPPRRDAQRPPRQDRPASGNPMPGPQGQGRGDGSQRGPRQAMPPRRDGGVDSASLSHGAGRRDRPNIDSERQADSASPRPAALAPAEIEARRERAALLRAYESSTLTKSNFCVLKRVSEADLDAALTQARQERGESMPRPHHR
ncbi:MAG TPA: ProQ/FINO family protein, partial [Rubrivivax sp.]|nr:ProQ/FINO family protein [Rubrivivax sp.]